MVLGIRSDGVGSADQGADRVGVSLRGCTFVFAGNWRMAAVAGGPAGYRAGAFSGDRGAMAHSGGIAESCDCGTSRLLLVLFRERTLPAISGEAVSAGLQQASCDALLDAAPGVAFPVEFIF